MAFSNTSFQKTPLSVTLIVKNEETHIAEAIQSVHWVREVIVVDSGSTDATVSIAKKWGARVFSHPWKGYGQQKNFAQSQASEEWVLNLDADERVSPELAQEIQKQIQEAPPSLHGFYIPRLTFYLDRWIYHGGWYPNTLLRLVRKEKARWTEPAVHERLHVSGPTLTLRSPLFHYSFGTIEDQIQTNLRFARLGSEELLRQGKKPSLFKLMIKPIGKFLETYCFKRGFLDGLPGFIISINAAHSMFLKQAYLFEKEKKYARTIPPHP